MLNQKKNKPLGQLLKELNLITEEQIKVALSVQKTSNMYLGEILQELDFVTSNEIAEAIALQHGLPYIELETVYPDEEALKLISYDIVKQKNILPIYLNEDTLSVAMEDINDIIIIDFIKKITNKKIKILVADKTSILKYSEIFYYQLKNDIALRIQTIIDTIKEGKEIDIPKVVELILENAIKNKATDIHITPEKLATHIFYRIDGVLHHFFSLPSALHQGILSRIKIISELDISEQRKPQDGSFSYEFLNEEFDLRVSTIPTNFGENVVLRILSKEASLFSLKKLGLTDLNIKKVEKSFSKPYGIVLIVGPTGSGKTTTLYSALRKMNPLQRNIMTIEDPIEYKFSFIKQTQLNEKAGYTFNSAIRSFMRQDPDVLLVGEIRDPETAELATRAAITGHFVLSTLHTNDAIGTIPRLEDLKVPSYLIAAGLLSIVSQRLIRKLCPICKEKVETNEEEIKEVIPNQNILKKYWKNDIYKAKGCDKCNHTGYNGREVVVEIMEINAEIKDLIIRKKSILEIEKKAKENGMITMREDGLIKVLQGKTSLDEINRVLE